MLKIISSKNESEIYKLAKVEKTKSKIETSFLDCELSESESLSQDVSIFGDKNAYLINIKSSDLEILNDSFISNLTNSEHFFLLVGSGAEFEKTFTSLGQKIIKPVEKIVFDFPAELVSALQKHDKKNSWNLLLKELSKKDAEPIHGSCIFAYKSLTVYMNDTKKNNPLSGVKDFSWKQAASSAVAGKRQREEVINKYFELIMSYHKARSGEGDLATQLEKWVLEN